MSAVLTHMGTTDKMVRVRWERGSESCTNTHMHIHIHTHTYTHTHTYIHTQASRVPDILALMATCRTFYNLLVDSPQGENE